MHVIAVPFPKTWRSSGRNSSLPAILHSSRHIVGERSGGPGRRVRLPQARCHVGRNQRIFGQKIVEREIRSPTEVVPMCENILASGVRLRRPIHRDPCGNTFPDIAQARPARDAMEIGEHLDAREAEIRRESHRIGSGPGRLT